MAIRNIEQERASKAYEFVQNVVTSENEETQKEYKAYVKKVPMLILKSGLGNTLAFIFSKRNKSKAYKLVYDQIFEWCLEKRLIHTAGNQNNDLNRGEIVSYDIQMIINKPISEYRLIASELITFFAWLQKFAEGSISLEES